MDVDALWRPLETTLWLRPLDLLALVLAWPLVLRNRATRSLRSVVLVGFGEVAFVTAGLAGNPVAQLTRGALLVLFLAGFNFFPWLLSGMDRADARYHHALIQVVDPTSRVTRRWREDINAAKEAVDRAGREIASLPPPSPRWERLHALLLDYYRNMGIQYAAGGGDDAPGYREASELLAEIKVEWRRAWQDATPFRR